MDDFCARTCAAGRVGEGDSILNRVNADGASHWATMTETGTPPDAYRAPNGAATLVRVAYGEQIWMIGVPDSDEAQEMVPSLAHKPYDGLKLQAVILDPSQIL